MRFVFDSILGGILAAAATTVASAQSVDPPSPASAPVPATAASKSPTRSAAVRAAENAKEPGNQRPEERVIPQISLPLKSRHGTATAATTASAPAGSVPGRVNEGVARCMAATGDAEKAACERGLAASGPVKSER